MIPTDPNTAIEAAVAAQPNTGEPTALPPAKIPPIKTTPQQKWNPNHGDEAPLRSPTPQNEEFERARQAHLPEGYTPPQPSSAATPLNRQPQTPQPILADLVDEGERLAAKPLEVAPARPEQPRQSGGSVFDDMPVEDSLLSEVVALLEKENIEHGLRRVSATMSTLPLANRWPEPVYRQIVQTAEEYLLDPYWLMEGLRGLRTLMPNWTPRHAVIGLFSLAFMEALLMSMDLYAINPKSTPKEGNKMRKDVSEDLVCPHCGKQLKTKKGLKSHITQKHPDASIDGQMQLPLSVDGEQIDLEELQAPEEDGNE